MWVGFIVLKPHSNWDHFSFVAIIFFCDSCVAMINTITNIMDVIQMTIIFILNFSF